MDSISATPPSHSRHPRRLDGVSVLLVEDNADARELLALVLEFHGALVTAAASVREALEAMGRSRPDIIVSDIGMPDEDGYDLIAQIRARPRADGGHTPALAVTAHSSGEDRARALRAGFQDLVGKPVAWDALLDVVAHLCGRR